MLARPAARRFAALGAALALASGLGCPSAGPGDPKPVVEDLFELSSLPQQIASVQDDLRGSLALRRPQFTERQAAIAERIASERFTATALEARVRAHLAENEATEHLEPALAWLRSPLGQRFVEAANRAASPESLEEMNAIVEQKHADPPSAVRLALIERYDAAANSADVTGKILLLAAFSGNLLVNAVKPEEDRLSNDDLRSIVDTQCEVLHPLFVEVAAVKTQLMLRSFSDGDVTSIVLFAESDDGRWYHRVTSTALMNAVQEMSIESEREFVAALASPPTS